jgi:hypothetical protein
MAIRKYIYITIQRSNYYVIDNQSLLSYKKNHEICDPSIKCK